MGAHDHWNAQAIACLPPSESTFAVGRMRTGRSVEISCDADVQVAVARRSLLDNHLAFIFTRRVRSDNPMPLVETKRGYPRERTSADHLPSHRSGSRDQATGSTKAASSEPAAGQIRDCIYKCWVYSASAPFRGRKRKERCGRLARRGADTAETARPLEWRKAIPLRSELTQSEVCFGYAAWNTRAASAGAIRAAGGH